MYSEINPHDGEIPARDEDEGTADLARELMAEAKRYARAELELTRAELKTLVHETRERVRLDVTVARRELVVEAKKAARAGIVTGAGGVIVHAAFYLFLFTIVFALATAMPLWAAALIMFCATAIGGGICLYFGQKKLREIKKPSAAIENVKGDSQWMKQRMRGLKSRILVSE